MLEAMRDNVIRGPVLTLVAAAVLGGGLWWIDTAAQPSPTTVDTAAALAPRPAPAAKQAPPEFPARGDFAGATPTRSGTLTVDVSVDGTRAAAYVCDGASLEVWLRGTARDGVLALTDAARSSRLDGTLRGADVAATLTMGTRRWQVTLAPSPGRPAVDAAAAAGDWRP